MERIDDIVGNVHADDGLATKRDEHAAAGTLERVVIEAGNRRRSRFRATTDAGTAVGVVLDRPAISAGDVLLLEDQRMIVVAFEPLEALAVALPDATDTALEATVELGHRIGNQHWDLAVEDGIVYVPLEADRHIVERVVVDVVPGSEVRETTLDADLFVTDLEDEPGYEHSHGDHDHSHDVGHGHTHDVDHGHTHGDGHGHSHGDDDGHDHHDHTEHERSRGHTEHDHEH